MPNCMVLSCPNNSCRRPSKDISYYRLPKSPKVRKKWLDACGKEDGQIKDGRYNIKLFICKIIHSTNTAMR